jgi:hypothetical protein
MLHRAALAGLEEVEQKRGFAHAAPLALEGETTAN